MSRIARKKAASSFAYVRHFAIGTVALAMGIGVFADGEAQQVSQSVAANATQSARKLTSSEARHQRNGTKSVITIKTGARAKMEQSAAAAEERAQIFEAASQSDERPLAPLYVGDGSGIASGNEAAEIAAIPLPANITVASLDGLTPQQRVEMVQRSRAAAAARLQAVQQKQAVPQPRMRQIDVPGQPPVMITDLRRAP